MDNEILTVVVECEYGDGSGEAYVIGSAKKGSEDLDRLIEAGRSEANEYVYGFEANYAIVLVGIGHNVEDVSVETADVVYSVEYQE